MKTDETEFIIISPQDFVEGTETFINEDDNRIFMCKWQGFVTIDQWFNLN